MPANYVPISGHLEVMQANGKYYLLFDSDLRKKLEDMENATEVDPTSTDFVPANIIFSALSEKLEAHVEGSTLIFSGSSSGQEAELQE